MLTLSHQKHIKQLNSIIGSYQKKLDDRVNEMFNHIINSSRNGNNGNQTLLPVIENKRVYRNGGYYGHGHGQGEMGGSRRKFRTQSIGGRSFIGDVGSFMGRDNTEAEQLFRTFKSKVEKQENKKTQLTTIIPAGRAIGAQTYAKPKIVRKQPEILSKQMRCDPFYEKNAIKAQQLGQGMLSLIERGKVGKNIDIITAFEKGRPILETHQAIFHHAQQKFTDSQLLKSHLNPSQKSLQKPLATNPEHGPPTRHKRAAVDDQTIEYQNNISWALTIPEDTNTNTNVNLRAQQEKQKLQNSRLFGGQLGMDIVQIQFLHYRVVRDQNFGTVKRRYVYYQYCGQILQIIHEIQKALKKYNVQIIYANINKIFDLAKRRQSLTRVKISDIEQCLVKTGPNKNNKIFNIKAIVNPQSKLNEASSLISSALSYALTRNKYIGVLKRKKYQNKIKQWILNGLIIKQYRKQLQVAKQEIINKFAQQQKHFKTNFSSIQQKKHYQIHIVNRQYMNKFKYFEEFCCTEITRIFNLENNNTNIIYVSPFELNVETINYYFKIMELEEIQNYSQRVTFLELEDITSKIKLPYSMNTSQKLYFNSKALRKLSRKVQNVPAYFVTNYPSEIDIKLSVHLGIPIYSGDFHKINPVRSALHSQRLLFQGIEPTPCLPIEPKQYNVFQLSNALIRYFESNKKYRKYVLKINNYHFSSGIALLTYPFSSLPEMYGNTALVQPFYFKSIQKYYSELSRNGGVIQRYEEGTKTVTLSAKIVHGEDSTVLGTFQRISNGFVNIGYIFPQKCVPHKNLVNKGNEILQRLSAYGHIGYVQLTFVVTQQQQLFLQEIELYSTKITNSLFYFKFLAGGYLNHMGQFMTKISNEAQQNEDQQIAPMQSRSYCYIPFMLHFGLTQKQTSSFFQLCRIGGVSFDLQSKFGTTFIILGSLKNTIGIITTAKDRKSMLKLVSKSAEFLIKQNSHNLSGEMLKEKDQRMKERFNISSIKDRIQEI